MAFKKILLSGKAFIKKKFKSFLIQTLLELLIWDSGPKEYAYRDLVLSKPQAYLLIGILGLHIWAN